MNKGTIHSTDKVAELNNPARPESPNASGVQPTAADLVLPEAGYNFCDEFVCLLTVVCGQRDFA